MGSYIVYDLREVLVLLVLDAVEQALILVDQSLGLLLDRGELLDLTAQPAVLLLGGLEVDRNSLDLAVALLRDLLSESDAIS